MTDELEVPDVAEPIVAYRSWTVNDDGGLCGAQGVLWPPRMPMVARCNRGCGECPSPPSEVDETHAGHGCGIYALVDEPVDQPPDMGSVWGEVRLYGRVYPYERGYRAEKAEIVCIYDTGPHCADVAAVYDVDLVPAPSRSVEERVAALQQAAAESAEWAIQSQGRLKTFQAMLNGSSTSTNLAPVTYRRAPVQPSVPPHGRGKWPFVDVDMGDGYSIRRNNDATTALLAITGTTWEVLHHGRVVKKGRRTYKWYTEKGPWITYTCVHDEGIAPSGDAFKAASLWLKRHRRKQHIDVPIFLTGVAIVAVCIAASLAVVFGLMIPDYRDDTAVGGGPWTVGFVPLVLPVAGALFGAHMTWEEWRRG